MHWGAAEGWVSCYGVPAVITSDRRAQFTSSLWAALCSLLNIQHNQTTAYHPQSNRMVERFQRRLKDALRASAQRPEKTTVPPPLRKCSARHSFYLANFWTHQRSLQNFFLNNFLRH